jgi:hypothetical protein
VRDIKATEGLDAKEPQEASEVDIMEIAVQEPVAEMDKRGRPCKYESHVEPHLDKIYKWLKKGYTDYSIADRLGIHQNTWMRYKDNYSILGDLYTRARAHKSALVMHKQYERAIGYEHKDLFIAQYQGQIVEKEIVKHYPPDVQAADLYLRNNMEDYKGAKSESGLTLIQNNYQLPEAKAEIARLLEEYRQLERLEAVDVEAIEST